MLRVSFYSYKGGSGRSTTAWNTIQRLVEIMEPTARAPFVIVDTDTESAGSTFLYRASEVFRGDLKKYKSIQKRMVETDYDVSYSNSASDDEKKAFFGGMYPVGTFFGSAIENEAVLLIGANLDKKSVKDADVFGKRGDNSEQAENFQSITKACRNYGAKALFFDTPSGTQYLARLSVRESEIIVCCMRPTSQFREGTRSQLIDFIVYDVEKRKERKYILTPTAVCVDKDQVFIQGAQECVYPDRAKSDIEDEFRADTIQDEYLIKHHQMQQNCIDDFKQAFKENVVMDMLKSTPDDIKDELKDMYPASDDNDSVFGIPEVKRFKWFEACLGSTTDKLSGNDKMAINRYQYLAQTILKHQKKK